MRFVIRVQSTDLDRVRLLHRRLRETADQDLVTRQLADCAIVAEGPASTVAGLVRALVAWRATQPDPPDISVSTGTTSIVVGSNAAGRILHLVEQLTGGAATRGGEPPGRTREEPHSDAAGYTPPPRAQLPHRPMKPQRTVLDG